MDPTFFSLLLAYLSLLASYFVARREVSEFEDSRMAYNPREVGKIIERALS
ncbi:MAG: hypothetical protein J7L91_04925 [Candidatus Korarchaeota archaeon]|nr:hypothetical protein [Candidatus Korarchaeota archaeon]